MTEPADALSETDLSAQLAKLSEKVREMARATNERQRASLEEAYQAGYEACRAQMEARIGMMFREEFKAPKVPIILPSQIISGQNESRLETIPKDAIKPGKLRRRKTTAGDDEPAPGTAIGRTWSFVRSHPGLKGFEIANALEAGSQPIKERSMRTAFNRLKERGWLEIRDGRWYAINKKQTSEDKSPEAVGSVSERIIEPD